MFDMDVIKVTTVTGIIAYLNVYQITSFFIQDKQMNNVGIQMNNGLVYTIKEAEFQKEILPLLTIQNKTNE